MMRRCRHLKAFTITVEVNDPSKAGLPPWMVACQDCSATIFEALEFQSGKITASQSSGKSGAAVTWARIKRLRDDIAGDERP